MNDGTFHGTKRALECARIRAGGYIIARPRWRTLSMDARVRVDDAGTIYYGLDVVGQCVPLSEPMLKEKKR